MMTRWQPKTLSKLSSLLLALVQINMQALNLITTHADLITTHADLFTTRADLFTTSADPTTTRAVVMVHPQTWGWGVVG